MPKRFYAIPEELRLMRQWLCWRYEDRESVKPTKVPYDPKAPVGAKYANVNDPQSWGGFDDALNTYSMGGYDGIGFVFTSNDPYTFIDLDDTQGDQAALERQLNIFREFDSYNEVSPSGKGLHIIVRGNVPSGRRRSYVEVYSSARYATMTGIPHSVRPIVDAQDKLMALWSQMSADVRTSTFKGTEAEVSSDNDVIIQAANASNGEKFKDLYMGNWQQHYGSQSEADFALIDILAFYTQNKNQLTRIFRQSSLGQRSKAARQDYVDRMISRSFDRILPPIDFDGFRNALNDKLAVRAPPPSNQPSSNVGIPIPPGLLGEIAQFVYEAAPRPVPEIAIAAAIGLMAGITGRAYNVSGTGLNQYVLLLAMTGAGKEAMASGIQKLMNSIRLQVPTAHNFIGPAEISSGQALYKFLAKNACFVSLLGEFGLRLQSMSNQNANGSDVTLRRMLLDLYNKSGHNNVAAPSIYSDRDKNTDAIQSPAFTILGESTPERFYGVLNEDMISEGLLPRFTIIEYRGDRVKSNAIHTSVQPSFSLVEKLASLAAQCETVQHANPRRVINVTSSPDAQQMLNDFDAACDFQINSSSKDIIRQLWNRAHVKVLKLSALLAVGCNMIEPVIETDHVQWAMMMIKNDIDNITVRFESGEIGSNNLESRQTLEIVRVIKEYLKSDWEKVAKYAGCRTLFDAKIVTYAYLSRRLMTNAAFRNDRLGATNAIKRAIQIMLDSDKLREINRGELSTKYNTTQRSFVLRDMSVMD